MVTAGTKSKMKRLKELEALEEDGLITMNESDALKRLRVLIKGPEEAG